MTADDLYPLIQVNLWLIRVVVAWLAILTVGFTFLVGAKVLTLRRIGELSVRVPEILSNVMEILKLVKEYLEVTDLARQNARKDFAMEIGETVRGKAKEGVKEAVADMTPIPAVVVKDETKPTTPVESSD